MRTIDRALFVEQSGATIVSRGGRLYLRYRGEYDELDMTIRTVIASGMGFVITSDAIRACTKKHIEMIITDATQSFVAIYGFYVPGNASRSGMAARMRQFAALANPRKKLSIAKDIIRRKIVAEHRTRHEVFIADLEACKSVASVRHVEAKSAQEWWHQWRDFELHFAKGFNPPTLR